MKVFYAVTFFLLVALSFYIYSNYKVTTSDFDADKSILATVAGHPITESEFKKQMQLRSGGATDYFSSLENRKQLLQEMIQKEMQVAVAKKSGIESDPEIINTYENMLVAKLREKQLQQIIADIHVSDNEIAQYYKEHLQNFTTPEMRRIAIIYMHAAQTASQKTREKIKARFAEVIKLAKTLPDSVRGFGSLAVQYSEHQASRYVGGDIGWLVNGKETSGFDGAVQQAATLLTKKNELSNVVEAGDGYYLLKLIETSPEKKQPLEVVSASIKRNIFHKKSELAEKQWLSSLDDYAIETRVNESALESIKPPETMNTYREKSKPPALPES